MTIAALLLASCSSDEPKGHAMTSSAYLEGVPGGTRVDTLEVVAAVTGIDRDKRKLTLTTPDGTKTTAKAGPEVVNFDQIRVGDQVKATVTRELVVFLRQPGMPRGEGGAAVVALAPVGGKPGGVVANTMEVTARVTSVDLASHKATLAFPDGSSRIVAVRPDVDLTKAKIGQEVVIQVTESVAISVEKP